MCRPCASAPPGPPGTKEQTATLLLGRCPPAPSTAPSLLACLQYLLHTLGNVLGDPATLEELHYLSYFHPPAASATSGQGRRTSN